jgi:hypothetical protein
MQSHFDWTSRSTSGKDPCSRVGCPLYRSKRLRIRENSGLSEVVIGAPAEVFDFGSDRFD